RDTEITFCTDLSDGGCALLTCGTYSGPPACIRTPNVACATASTNVVFCQGVACDGVCTPFIPCRFPIEPGFCLVPQTQSSLVLS
ncbi:hypothetical protein C8R44DRAFT_533604, partial [Mycena epipterygia]